MRHNFNCIKPQTCKSFEEICVPLFEFPHKVMQVGCSTASTSLNLRSPRLATSAVKVKNKQHQNASNFEPSDRYLTGFIPHSQESKVKDYRLAHLEVAKQFECLAAEDSCKRPSNGMLLGLKNPLKMMSIEVN